MSNQSEFFQLRVREEEGKAEAATLVNVRNGHLRAAAAWDVLAQRAIRGEELRNLDEQRKIERDLAAKDALTAS